MTEFEFSNPKFTTYGVQECCKSISLLSCLTSSLRILVGYDILISDEKNTKACNVNLIFCFRMGSFTSAPKIINDDILDKDVNFVENISRSELLHHCQRQPKVHPMFKRAWRAKDPDSNYSLKVRKLNAVSKGRQNRLLH